MMSAFPEQQSQGMLAKQRVADVWQRYLAQSAADNLRDAMQYSLDNGGKLLRPQLVYAAGELFGAPLEALDVPATAIELMHTYSLIHDDLPCMDNADLRRGKPTCHCAFDEGKAVLAGDALQTLSLQIIAVHPAPLSALQRLEMITVLTQASGISGMAAGQALDIALLHRPGLTLGQLEAIFRLKTGALFAACLELAWLAAVNRPKNELKEVQVLGELIGLAFQIQDDILDIEASTAVLGKPQGIDQCNEKVTYPLLTSLPAAKQKVASLFEQAMTMIAQFGEATMPLTQLITQILHRAN